MLINERIYKLTLDIKNPESPFSVIKSISSESSNLVKVFAGFQLLLIQLLQELSDEEIYKKYNETTEDDIPF